MHLRKRTPIILIIITAMLLSFGCGNSQIDKSRSPQETQADFTAFADEMFRQEVTGDSLTLNYSVANPQNYQITSGEPTLGTYSVEAMKQQLAVVENQYQSLQTFDRDHLDEESKLLYDDLAYLLPQTLEQADYLLYSEQLGPTSGIQAQLPILLAEFHFYNKESIDTYLGILKDVGNFFDQIIAFEKEKKEAGLFMATQTADDIIAQCKTFIAKPEKNYLLSTFNENIKSVEGLTQEEQKNYEAANKEAVLEVVIPAYKRLIDALKELESDDCNQKGLANLPKGKDYYEWKVGSLTGSDRSISEIQKLLEQTLSSSQKTLSKIISKDPDCYYDAANVSYPSSDPEEILEILKERCKENFPELVDVNYDIHYVDKSLQDSLSPAFYLSPAIDKYDENPIYINAGNKDNMANLFPTLGHEGYPGHLYQAAYFAASNPHPLRSVLNVGGYSEGWGTYAELYSYRYADIDSNVALLLEKNLISTLCVYAQTDIGIHYEGWGKKKTKAFLAQYGFSEEIVTEIYNTMIADPGNYVKYTLGYLEIADLKNTASKALGADFDEKSFHQFLMQIGPTPFPVIREHMEDWIKEQG